MPSNYEWAKAKCDEYYKAIWRWIEDTYLKYFGENRMSYGIKGKAFKIFFFF